MASKKAGGTAKNLRDSNPKYLGVKLSAGQAARVGMVILRQRGTKVLPGRNVGIGKDHPLFALKDGKVSFKTRRKVGFNNRTLVKNIVEVL